MGPSASRVVAAIPARLDSSRLPQKHLREMANRRMIDYLADRMSAVPEVDDLIVATSRRSIDDPLEEWADSRGIGCYRGDLNDVLGRLTNAARKHEAEIVVRANGDNPLLAPEITSAGITTLRTHGYEYVTGKPMFTGLPVGVAPGVFKAKTLHRLDAAADEPYHREHVVPYIFENPNDFEWAPISIDPLWKAREYSLTVDTPKEFNYVTEVIESLPDVEPGEWLMEDIITIAKRVREN